MKKFAVILLVLIITVIVASSCNKPICPAYSNASVENTRHNNG